MTTGSISASASSDSGTSATATADEPGQHAQRSSAARSRPTTVEGAARGSTSGRTARGDFSGATVSGLTVLGSPPSAGPNGRVALGDWGYLVTLEQGTDRAPAPAARRASTASSTALDVHLTAPHGGLPAGSEIQVGYAEASVQASARRRRSRSRPGRRRASRSGRRSRSKTPVAPEPTKHAAAAARRCCREPPTGLQPKLTAGGYVFPVYGPSSFGDTFGAFRGDVAGNWHHGDDIFAPLGAPILACADGIVFSVGWNDVGGNRLWLRDSQGNEFYYAHLSAFSPLAQNGTRVKAGEVLGFVGNTGDAQGTPTHLHFEVHPSSLLFMGYDGAVDPTPYLDAWQHLQDVRFYERRRLARQDGHRRPGAEAGGDPAAGLGHLRGERPRPRLAAARDVGPRPADGEGQVAQGARLARRRARSALAARVAARVAAVAELLVLAEDLVLQPAAGLGPGHRVEEDPERDAGEQQRAVARPCGSGLPWIRSAASRRSSIAERSWSWMSLSVATLVATPVTPRLPISSS